MIAEIRFMLGTIDDVSEKALRYAYAVNSSVSRDLDVELHNALSNFGMPSTFEELVEKLSNLCKEKGYRIKCIEGKSLSTLGYIYEDGDFVGDSVLVVECDRLRTEK